MSTTKDEINSYIEKWESLAKDYESIMEEAKKSSSRGAIILAIWVMVAFTLTTFAGLVVEPKPVAIFTFFFGYFITIVGAVFLLLPLMDFYEVYRKARAARFSAREISHNWILLRVLQDKNFNWKDLDDKFMEGTEEDE